MFVSPGLVLLGYVLERATNNEEIFTIMLGVSGLVFFISLGLLLAARITERSKATRKETPLV